MLYEVITVAGNNVFITARYLNLNGTVQSGRPDRTVTLTSAMDADISAFVITSYSIHYTKLYEAVPGSVP